MNLKALLKQVTQLFTFFGKEADFFSKKPHLIVLVLYLLVGILLKMSYY